MTPFDRLYGSMLTGFLAGGLVAGASGYDLLGVVVLAFITTIGVGVAMVIRLSLEARDRRAHMPVVREPRSHVRTEEVA